MSVLAKAYKIGDKLGRDKRYDLLKLSLWSFVTMVSKNLQIKLIKGNVLNILLSSIQKKGNFK